MKEPASQLSTEEILQSMRGLKVKDSQEETQTSCDLPRSEIQALTEELHAGDQSALIKMISQSSHQKSRTTQKSLFDSNGFKVPKNPGLLKKQQSQYKAPSAKDCPTLKIGATRKDLCNWKAQKFPAAGQQDLEAKQANNYFESQISRQNQSSILNVRSLISSSEKPTKERISTLTARANIFSVNGNSGAFHQGEFPQKIEELSTKEILYEKGGQRDPQSDTNQYRSCDKSQKSLNFLQVTPLTSSQKAQLDRVYLENQRLKQKRLKQSAKQVPTSFLNFYQEFYSKLRLKHPGHHQYQLTSTVLQHFNKRQTNDWRDQKVQQQGGE